MQTLDWLDQVCRVLSVLKHVMFRAVEHINVKRVFRFLLFSNATRQLFSSIVWALASVIDAKGCKANLTNGQTDIYVPIAPVGAKNIYYNLSIIFFVKSEQIAKASSFLHHVHKSCSKHD